MAITWDQMPLTAGQRTAIQSLVAWKEAQLPETPISPPPLTYSQIKTLRQWLGDLELLISPAKAGGSLALQYYRDKAVSDFDAANP